MLKKFSLRTAAILSLSSALLLSGCGLKSGLYLPSPKGAPIPVESTPVQPQGEAAQPAAPAPREAK